MRQRQRVYWTPELEAKVRKMREEGSSVDDVSRETGISLGNVYAYLKKHGISAKVYTVKDPKRKERTGKYAHLR